MWQVKRHRTNPWNAELFGKIPHEFVERSGAVLRRVTHQDVEFSWKQEQSKAFT
jgi:hypothetical protein